MANFIIRNRLTDAESMTQFDEDGYHFHEELSSDTEWVFTR